MSQAPDEQSRSALQAWMRALELTAQSARQPQRTLPIVIDECAGRFGDAPALLSDQQCLSHRELAMRSHRYARWALQEHLAKGDVVCLLMENCPEYLATWLGLTRAGVVVALLNVHLRADALLHAIRLAKPKHILVGASLWSELGPPLEQEAQPARVWAVSGDAATPTCLDPILARLSDAELSPQECPLPSGTDRALYIYTSGTTGMPKAANVSHFRAMQWSHWFAGMMGTGPSDRLYNCLPMYHSVGGVVAVGAALVTGGSVVVRPRFSARQFWDDIARWDCTLFQYIGELCRILVKEPPHPREATHRIRIACGNGLGADIWERFQDRFKIPQIFEFYAATEANFSLYNYEGKPGALGRVPPFLAHRFPVKLVRFDVISSAPMRDASGHCVRCAADEVGEAISQVSMDDANPARRFEGYTDPGATSSKILRDVFAPGDAWYRSGDLMRRDGAGFFYFVDRVGDTFRWKGENVSTTEVAATVCASPGVADALVYGVPVPGHDGRAGMAALITGPEFTLEQLWQHADKTLPRYARPLFVRLLREFDLTGTFKPRKHELAQAGFDPAASTDPLYVRDSEAGRFVPLDAPIYRRLCAGDWRF
ncbi:AMP-dependent synthetase and ligase [Burkholderiales bacterium]|nr:AMP-dependent synthetase and ligase [Burkholderiales bacterium]